jgi:hypothetical protein
MPLSNVLYVTVLPIVRLPKHRGLGVFDKIGSFGSPPRGILDFTSTETVEPVEQVLTLFSDRNLATEFFENEVHDYLRDFQEVANKYLRGRWPLRHSGNTECQVTGRVSEVATTLHLRPSRR